MYLVRIVV